VDRGDRDTLHKLRGVWRMAKRIQALEEIDINRLTAAVIVPRRADVYLGLLQNCDNRIEMELNVGIDGKSSSIEAFVDIDNGQMTIVDNGEGITPETLTNILNSSGINMSTIKLILDDKSGTREKSVFSHSGSCTSSS
jgi:hypothetical protein